LRNRAGRYNPPEFRAGRVGPHGFGERMLFGKFFCVNGLWAVDRCGASLPATTAGCA